MDSSSLPPRPATPQVLLHRLPDKPDDAAGASRKPSKYIVLIMGGTGTAGKTQIATDVARALACTVYNGDSMHDSCAKAASVGASRAPPVAASADEDAAAPAVPGPNEARYRRMWLSKLTRTGLLFPEESRPATEGFSGFGGTSSTSTSRRGSVSSVASNSSSTGASSGVASSFGGESAVARFSSPPGVGSQPAPYVLNPVFTVPESERLRRANPALMVLMHPPLEAWHKLALRDTVGEYGIGIIFVPLWDDEDDEEDEELPVLRPLDPRTMTSFPTSLGQLAQRRRLSGTLDEEMKLRINTESDVEGQTAEIVEEVREMMGVDE